MIDMQQSVILKRLPGQRLSAEDFELSNASSPKALGEAEVRVSVRWLSIDPYQRGLLDPVPMFGRRVMVGDVMAGRSIGEVVESRSERFVPGDWVVGETGWTTEAVVSDHALARVDVSGEFCSRYLGILGVPGMTAFLGLEAMGGVGPGDVLLVSSAAGAVGSTVVQLAKDRGATVIGLTSGSLKSSFLREQLKVDKVIDRQHGRPLPQVLLEEAPQGISCFFDNVGEQVLVDGLAALRPRGRALLCGYVAGYEASVSVAPQETLRTIMRQRLEVRGFLVHDYASRMGEARRTLEAMLRSGRLQAVETVSQGLGSAPQALCDLLAGRAYGKLVIQV